MSTVIVYSLPFSGHVNPILPLAAELVQRGEQIFFYATDDFQEVIEHTGATFRSYGSLDFTGMSLTDNPFKLIACYLRPFPVLMEKCLPEAQALQPDYIIHDTTAPWGSRIAEILQVPSVGSQAVLLLQNQMLLFNIPQAFRFVTLALQARKETDKLVRMLKSVASTYHLKAKSLQNSVLCLGDLTIAYTSRAFQPMERFFNERFLFIGPSTRDRGECLDFPLEQLEDRRVIYISLGTIFNNQPGFYRMCLEAFGNTKYQVVMPIGKQLRVEDLGPLPDNFLVCPYVPQLQVMSQANLYIGHGGLNTVLEALWYGVPMQLFPQGADQYWVAQRVKQLGAGEASNRLPASAAKLRAQAEQVLTQPAYAQASRQIGESLHTAGGVSKAADVIDEFKRSRKIGQTTTTDDQDLQKISTSSAAE
jgi:MGT family glycosyltransferase